MFTAVAGARESDEVLWLFSDHQGTVRDIVDSRGTHRKHVDYNSFGDVLGEQYYDTDGAPIPPELESTDSEAVDQLFGYTGQVRDEESDLYYYRARWYDPSIGRFVSEDPLGFDAGDTNLYRYVQNSPHNFVDPSGMLRDDPKAELAKSLVGMFDVSIAANATIPTWDNFWNDIYETDEYGSIFGFRRTIYS